MKIHMNFKKYIFTGVGILLLFCKFETWAVCLKEKNWTPIHFSMDSGSVLLPNNTRVGDKFFEKRFNIAVDPTIVVMRCEDGGAFYYQPEIGNEISGYSDVYSTSIPGVGYRLKYQYGNSPLKTAPYSTIYPVKSFVVLGNPQTFILELIKTGDVTEGGSIGNGPIMALVDDRATLIASATISANVSRIVLPSCTVEGSTIQVPLGRVSTKLFKGVKSTAGARPFEIRLNCRSGENYANNVYLRMDAQKDSSINEPGVLQLTGKGDSGVARGVAIKVVRNSRIVRPVEFGKEELVGPSKNGTYELSYTASYIQTAEEIVPGRANGVAYFNVEYK